jgi:hypothetical protein
LLEAVVGQELPLMLVVVAAVLVVFLRLQDYQ